MSASDIDLMARIHAGDLGAIGELYDRYVGVLFPLLSAARLLPVLAYLKEHPRIVPLDDRTFPAWQALLTGCNSGCSPRLRSPLSGVFVLVISLAFRPQGIFTRNITRRV